MMPSIFTLFEDYFNLKPQNKKYTLAYGESSSYLQIYVFTRDVLYEPKEFERLNCLLTEHSLKKRSFHEFICRIDAVAEAFVFNSFKKMFQNEREVQHLF